MMTGSALSRRSDGQSHVPDSTSATRDAVLIVKIRKTRGFDDVFSDMHLAWHSLAPRFTDEIERGKRVLVAIEQQDGVMCREVMISRREGDVSGRPAITIWGACGGHQSLLDHREVRAT
jgi:hypothetical protein